MKMTKPDRGQSVQPGVTPRQIALASALAATLAATLWLAQQEGEDEGVVTPPARAGRASRPAPSAATTTLPSAPLSALTLQRPPWPVAPAAQLAAWSAPPPPAPPPAPPPTAAVAQVPVAPPFPYQLIGRLEQGGVSQALLAGTSRSISAKPGDVIDGQWRVERVEATGLALTWLPGQQTQTINFRPS